jgi:hypothetical protein
MLDIRWTQVSFPDEVPTGLPCLSVRLPTATTAANHASPVRS